MRVHQPQRFTGVSRSRLLFWNGLIAILMAGTSTTATASPASPQGAGPGGDTVPVPSPDPAPNTAALEVAGDSDAPAADLDVLGRRIEDTTVRYPPSTVRGPIIGAGLAVLGVAYGVGAATSAAWPEVPGADFLYVPIAGPWMSLSQLSCSEDNPDCGALLALRGTLLVIDGLAQLGGLIMVGEGFFMTTEAAGPPAAGLQSIRLAPFAGEQGSGLSIHGRF